MPMVPQFQGGVPQVQDNGSVGAAIVRLPESNFDYAKVMEKALTPVNEFANSFTKTMEVERARMIKAESDDAERQAMDVINDKLMGENGYLGQSGKNAVDGYQSAMEGLRSGIDSVVSKLTPQARQAVESRIYDRLQSATNQANQHRMIQNKQWQLGSSEGRIDALIKDISLHYSDAEYQRKSIASLMQEAEYTASLKGYDAEQTKAYKEQNYGLAMSSAYSQWASNDPVGAYSAFHMNREGMDPKVAARLEGELFNKSKGVLAYGLASEAQQNKDAKWLKDPLAKTGNVFIDSLSDDKRLQITIAANGFVKQHKAQEKAEMKAGVENSLAMAEAGSNEAPLTLDYFTDSLGKDEGQKRYNEYLMNFTVAQFKSGVSGLSNEDMDSLISAWSPKEGDADFATRTKQVKQLKKTIEEIKETRAKDPIEYLMGTVGQSVKPISDWSQQSSFNALTSRLGIGRTAQKMYGTQAAILTKEELSAMTKHFDNLGSNERITFLNQVVSAMQEPTPVIDDDGSETYKQGDANYGISALVGQLIDAKSNSQLKTALMLTTDRNVEIGRKFIIGEQRITDKDPAIANTTAAALAEFNLSVGATGEVDGVFDNEEDKRIAQRAFSGVNAYNGYSSTSNTIDEVFGSVEEWNGKKIFMPRRQSTGKTYKKDSWFVRDFSDMVKDATTKLGKEKGTIQFEGLKYTKEAFASILANRQFQSVGNGRYYIKADPRKGYGYAQNPDGSYFVLDVLK